MKDSGMSDTEFVPTPAMLRYARVCAAHDVQPDEESRCRAAGISPRSPARWRSDPRFSDWLRAEIRRHLSGDVWEVWAVVNRLAREGNLQAAKLMLDRFGPAGPPDDASGPETFRALAELAREPPADNPEGNEH